MRQFLDFRLGDNDFVSPMRYALEHLWHHCPEQLKTAPLERINEAMIRLVAGFNMGHHALDGHEIRDCTTYLHNIADTRELRFAPTNDTDHGSITIDLNTGFIWTH